MAGVPVAVEGVSASYGRGDGAGPVLEDLHLTIGEGEILGLLGPSGCGKSTLLRVVAGLHPVDAGVVRLGGDVVSSAAVRTPPERRGVGLIFQSGALFPHLDVASNVGYGLPRGERHGGGRVDEMLDLVGLAGYGGRRPDELSGGEQQRVALARALAPSPSVVLMDEPFANLDAVLRRRLRREVADVVRAAGVTVLFVTHDRDEAFAMADRVAVMRSGRVVQAGSPREVYAHPVDRWVAEFVGDANWLPDPAGGDAEVLVRPEALRLGVAGAGEWDVTVVGEEYLGPGALVTVTLADGRSVVVWHTDPALPAPPGAPLSIRRV